MTILVVTDIGSWLADYCLHESCVLSFRGLHMTLVIPVITPLLQYLNAHAHSPVVQRLDTCTAHVVCCISESLHPHNPSLRQNACKVADGESFAPPSPALPELPT